MQNLISFLTRFIKIFSIVTLLITIKYKLIGEAILLRHYTRSYSWKEILIESPNIILVSSLIALIITTAGYTDALGGKHPRITENERK